MPFLSNSFLKALALILHLDMKKVWKCVRCTLQLLD